MSAETDIVTALAAPAVVALVGTRVYPDARPQESDVPAIVYQRTSTRFDLAVSNAVAVTRATVAIGVYAASRSQAEAVADAANVALVNAGLIPLNRAGDYDADTDGYIVASLFDHIDT